MTTVDTGPWWAEYADMLHPDMLDMVAAETTAGRITTWETHLVPGLLQTAAYARAVMAAASGDPDLVERGARLRSRRQDAILRPDLPAELVAYIDEAALRRVPHGVFMAGQWAWLLDMANRPNVTIRVLPLDGPPVTRASAPFTLLQTGPAGAHIESLFTEGAGGADLRYGGDVVARYRDLAGLLDLACLPPNASAALISGLAV